MRPGWSARCHTGIGFGQTQTMADVLHFMGTCV
jgi:hypothetical protein